MTRETLRQVFRLIAEYLLRSPRARVKLILHGGEPLVLTSTFFKTMINIRDEVLDGVKERFSCGMQSNLTLLSDRKVRLLKGLLDKGVGTSFDMIPGLRGIEGGQSLEKAWFKGLEVARHNGFSTGLVYVVHRKTAARLERVYYYLRNLPCVHNVRFNPLYLEGRAKGDPASLQLSPEEWGEFLIRFWELWEDDDFAFPFNPLQEWRAFHEDGESRHLCCTYQEDCQQGHLGIEPDGEVFGCGRWADTRTYSFGNVHSHSLEEILGAKARAALSARAAWLAERDCAACRWWDYCHGGCSNDAFLHGGTIEARSHWCQGNLKFFDRCLGKPRS